MPDQQPTGPGTGDGGTNQDNQGNQGTNQPDPGAAPQGQAATAPPASGDTTDWKAHAKEWERRAKENAAARKELDDLKAAQMTEQQKLEARAAAAEAKVAALEKAQLRHAVAAAKGLPAEMAERLQGDTREDLEADADALLAIVKPTNGGQPTARPNLGQGARGGGVPTTTADDWIRGMASRNRH